LQNKKVIMAYLAADIGGTKTHLILYSDVGCLKDQKYKSHSYPDLESILKDFIKGCDQRIEKACFAIAGPIQNQKCTATNLPWVIDAKIIEKELKIAKVSLINDLEANAYGLSTLGGEDLCIINEGDPYIGGNLALISAGTGLGEAGLYSDGKSIHPFASEGGHVDFGPRDDIEVQLFKHLHSKYGHVSYERILSGYGFFELYLFYTTVLGFPKCSKVENRQKESDPSAIISEEGLSKRDKTCDLILDRFVSIYGAEAGNFALKILSTGGLYVGGGIAPKILERIKNGLFLDSFVKKGRFEGLLRKIPIKIILDENTALKGARLYCNKF
jgi:glucokinase